MMQSSLLQYDYFFFDCDGVIIDSVDIKTEAFYEMYKQHGRTIANKVIRHHRWNGGMSRFEKFRYYHAHFLGKTVTKQDVLKLAKKFSTIVLQKVLRTKFIPGALDFLKLCKKNQKKCFLVSGTPTNEIKIIAKKRGFRKYFDEIKGSPVSKGENISSIIKKYKIEPVKAVFFGDSINDAHAARKNHIHFIGINYFLSRNGIRNFLSLVS